MPRRARRTSREGRTASEGTAPARPAPRARLTAREMEARAAAAVQVVAPAPRLPEGEAMAMLARRGFRPGTGRPDLPFRPDLDEESKSRLADQLGHYSFRLFLRGAIQRRGDFAAGEATRYLSAAQQKALADSLVAAGILVHAPGNRYRFVRRATNFGPTLEWYVARELRRRLGCDVATGVKFRAPGLGGDLDVVAAMEGKLVYVELKSSPPKHLTHGEVVAFVARVRRLRPDVAVFAMDTALRLSDRVLPMFAAALGNDAPRRIERDLWALTPHLYAVSAKSDLATNICRVIAEGFLALGPLTSHSC